MTRHYVGVVLMCLILTLAAEARAQKKGGETCEKDSECATNVCASGKCDPCPDRSNCPPPGTCSDSDYGSFRDEVERWCKGPERSCQSIAGFDETEVDCSDLKARLEVAEKCVKARDDVMSHCFKGGDDAHQKERSNAADVRNSCQELIRHKQGVNSCYDCSPSDYSSYTDDLRRACDKTTSCDESKDETKVECNKIEEKWNNAKECLNARNYIVDRCLGGHRNSKRELSKQKSEAAIANCKEVLDYKRDKKLCL